jgi:hypothetical protein
MVLMLVMLSEIAPIELLCAVRPDTPDAMAPNKLMIVSPFAWPRFAAFAWVSLTR